MPPETTSGDVPFVAQRIVFKAEVLHFALKSVAPSRRALELARITDKDQHLVELILSEAIEALRARYGVLIVRHHRGYVMENAGRPFQGSMNFRPVAAAEYAKFIVAA